MVKYQRLPKILYPKTTLERQSKASSGKTRQLVVKTDKIVYAESRLIEE